jgi:hypothetical protein
MSQAIHVQIIKEARALIADEAHWCRRQIALDAEGMAVCATDRRASKLCAYGALIASARHMTNDCDQSYRLVSRAVTEFGGSTPLIEVNDAGGHTAVIALFDDVIARQRVRSLAWGLH